MLTSSFYNIFCPYVIPYARPGGFPGTQVILPLAHTVEHEEFLEVVRLEGHTFSPEDIALARDMYLLQLCSGLDENATGGCAQLVFAPIDETCDDDAPLLPSGFRVIPLDPKSDKPSANRTLDLASTLEVGPGGARPPGEADLSNYNVRSVLTIAFQFTYENHLRDNVAVMARQYVRSVISPVFTFANQAGLDMLETTLVALQDIMLDKVLDEAGRKVLLSEFSKIMQQGFAYLPAGICVSSMGRPISYDQAIAWKVLTDDNSSHYLAFMFLNWSFV
ncbi:hypothetical protein POM88_025373 [Heracleum sosnowskyi]|uniref:MEKHLA domain-containing protein n=1 Tax=Heracleum sosnowskyi TaxID=360622 RepID=A0AAD8I555_9APIA|nr:hypothetical protein POM88_025373 [Heracleum sosnowskyi]